MHFLNVGQGVIMTPVGGSELDLIRLRDVYFLPARRKRPVPQEDLHLYAQEEDGAPESKGSEAGGRSGA